MSEGKKVLTLGYVPYGTGQVRPFDTIFESSMKVSPKMIEEGKVDALVIWGGEDISPTIYGERPQPLCGAGVELSDRDHIEVEVCQAAMKVGVPIIGVCRGAQLLCALAGGKLHQHVTGHMGNHEITTHDGQQYVTSSIHHQMMDVSKLRDDNYKLIAWTTNKRAQEIPDEIEPEIVYFPKIKGLAIQGHPEFMDSKDTFVEYTRTLVNRYLLGESRG